MFVFIWRLSLLLIVANCQLQGHHRKKQYLECKVVVLYIEYKFLKALKLLQ